MKTGTNISFYHHIQKFISAMKGKEFNQSDLVSIVAERTGLPVNEVQLVIETAFGATAEAVGKHGRVEYKDLGVLKTRVKKAQEFSLNGQSFSRPVSRKSVFRPSPNFKEWATDAGSDGLPVY